MELLCCAPGISGSGLTESDVTAVGSRIRDVTMGTDNLADLLEAAEVSSPAFPSGKGIDLANRNDESSDLGTDAEMYNDFEVSLFICSYA